VLIDVRDGKISRIRTYSDHGEALRAAGLAEEGSGAGVRGEAESTSARDECFHGDAGAPLHLGLACAKDELEAPALTT
jgi:hypothetical protein